MAVSTAQGSRSRDPQFAERRWSCGVIVAAGSWHDAGRRWLHPRNPKAKSEARRPVLSLLAQPTRVPRAGHLAPVVARMDVERSGVAGWRVVWLGMQGTLATRVLQSIEHSQERPHWRL
ncbi:MAG: hypothetical protein CTY31_06835 [Hyphomicrobium sp.]|nr:MAG: hypothetical protein CTY39_10955 [Hyphomicrobium sp.]PPD00778.1 MAG: hypothetical protein CTY31_06835 [Hyphomicrobium sp.]